VWVGFHDSTEREIAAEGKLAAIRAWGAKAAEHAGRLAAVLTVYGDPDAQEVAEAEMRAAVRLVQHYGGEMLRLAGSSGIDPDLRLAARVLEWWQGQPRTIVTARVYQYGPQAVRDAATARRVLTVLADHGHATALRDVIIDGAMRREAWERVP